jgi:cell division protein FtsZ
MGIAIMGTGVGEGDGRAMMAANHAVSSPLLEDASVKGARGVIINVTGGPDLSLIEVSEASAIIQEAAHEDANIIFGAVVDPKMEGKVKITVIATGFDRAAAAKQVIASAAATPVDLQSYTAFQQTEKIAAAGGGGSRMSIPVPTPTAGATPAPPPPMSMPLGRRPILEMPVPAAAAAGDPANDTFSPGAEFEPVSPLDVPAFLRRQNEG